jgi:galactarate dehydratase
VTGSSGPPALVQVHPRDNVAIVADEGGLDEGARLPGGLALRERVAQGHKVSLTEIPAGAPVLRYGIVIGKALDDIPAGSWVHEQRLRMPAAPVLSELPISTMTAALPPLTGHTFRGYRNPDGSVGTRNLLAITTTVQCVAGVVEHAVRRIKAQLLPRYPKVDDVVGLEHTYGCGVAIDVAGAEIPIRTLRNIGLNPNFGGELLVVSLGCEKLQPERLLKGVPIIASAGAIAATGVERSAGRAQSATPSACSPSLAASRCHARQRRV